MRGQEFQTALLIEHNYIAGPKNGQSLPFASQLHEARVVNPQAGLRVQRSNFSHTLDAKAPQIQSET